MEHKKKVIIVSSLLIGLGGLYIYKNMTKKPPVEADANTDDTTKENKADFDKSLTKGILGKEVIILQKALKGGLVTDGNFGTLTEKRLKAITGKTSITLNQYNEFIKNRNKK